MSIEKRSLVGPVKPVEGQPSKLRGYAAKFDSPSLDLGGFTEVIRKGAFSRSLKGSADILAFAHHDSSRPLARRSAGTLTLSEDDVGLAVEIQLADTTHASDVSKDIQAGNIDGMSFSFRVNPNGARWAPGSNGGPKLRELMDVELIEVSPVTVPAYPDTSVAVRSMPKDEPAAAVPEAPSVSTEQLQKLSSIYVRLVTLPT